MRTGFYPFWFWNERMTAEEIRWQVKEMAEKGLRGFFIHPRQGLGQPYLSRAFFEMVDVAIEAAEKHNLIVHLYDEYPYPSGVAGGEVIMGNPKYLATRLVQETHDVPGGEIRLSLPRGKILSLMAYPLREGKVDWARGLNLSSQVGILLSSESYTERGLTIYNRKRYWANQPTPILEAHLPPRAHRIFVSAQILVENHKYWQHFVDSFNPEAVRRFIELTHERYRARYHRKFGTRILSIFVDETFPVWSDRIPEEFMREYGYDLLPLLPALQDPSHPKHLKVAHDLHRLKYRLFCDSFERQISEWCRANGLAYSGEKNSLRLAQLRYMDIPGCEPGHTKAGAKMDLLGAAPRSNARATASAAYFYGKSGALCECFHSLGWSATLQDIKLIAEGLLLAGIRYLVPHAFFASTHALRKHDAPPSFFFQMPYWPFFGKLSQRVERIGALFDGTHIDAQLLLVEPSSGLPTQQDLEAYVKIHELLTESHLDYMVADTDILTQGRIEGGRVHIREIAARGVVLPPMRVIEPALLKWLADFEREGGLVIRCKQPFSTDSLRRQLARSFTPSLSVRCRGKEITALQLVKRVSDERTIWFVLNPSSRRFDATFEAGHSLREIPLDENLPPSLEKKDGRYRRVIHPFDSFMLEASNSREPSQRLPRVKVKINGLAKIRPLNRNLLRMGEWRMSLLDENGNPTQTAVVPAIPLINQLQRGRFSFAPQINILTSAPPTLTLPETHVRYEYEFENAYAGAVELVMEPDSIMGDWQLFVNDSRPHTLKHFKPTSAHVRGSLGMDVTPLLKRGKNKISIDLLARRHDEGLRNPLYLAGDFGVLLNPPRLTAPLAKGLFEDYTHNRMPYYAGSIEYTTTFRIEDPPAHNPFVLELEYPSPFHEASEVSINGGPFHPVLWEPRCIVLHPKEVRCGLNLLTTRVHTTLIRSFEGEWFDHIRHESRPVGER